MNGDALRALVRDHTENAVARSSTYPFERAVVGRLIRSVMASSYRIAVLDAPRRTGKSIAFWQVAARLRREGVDVAYCDLSDPRTRGVALDDLVRELSPATTPTARPVLLLDEVHYAGDAWSRALKQVVDRQDSRSPRIAIADSALSFVRSALQDDLADRHDSIRMHPLSFSEWHRLKQSQGVPVPSIEDEVGMARESHEYLWLGGFPAHATRRDQLYAVREDLRNMVVHQAVQEDIGRLIGLRHTDALERLFVARLAESGAQLNVAQAAASSEVSGPTARHWLRALCDTGLLWTLDLHGRSSGKFERMQPKLYAVDPSLVGACALPVFGRDDERDATLDGRAIETAVAQALRVFSEPSERRLRLSVHQARGARGAADGEIDFVLEDGTTTVALEVTRHHDEKKLAKLVRTGRAIGATWFGVVSMTRTRREVTLVDGQEIHLLPLFELLLGLARSEVWPW